MRGSKLPRQHINCTQQMSPTGDTGCCMLKRLPNKKSPLQEEVVSGEPESVLTLSVALEIWSVISIKGRFGSVCQMELFSSVNKLD